MNTLSLNGSWTMYFAPEKGGRPDAYSPAFRTEWPAVNAHVPGMAQETLVNAGLEQDPFPGLP